MCFSIYFEVYIDTDNDYLDQDFEANHLDNLAVILGLGFEDLT